jgi:hypothetical protein
VRRGSGRASVLLRPIGTLAFVFVLFGSSVLVYLDLAREPLGFSAAPADATELSTGQRLAGNQVAFEPSSVHQAASWLAARVGPADVILAHPRTGNYLAGLVPGRVYVGHWVATRDYASKVRAARAYYQAPDLPEGQRFLRDNNIRYVVYGPVERSAGGAPPSPDEHLSLVYSTVDITIFERSTRAGTASSLDPDRQLGSGETR